MQTLTLAVLSNIAQIATSIITFVGIVVSIWLFTKALREVQLDRRLRNKPHLAFETEGYTLTIQFIKIGYHIGGYDPKYVKEIFSYLPEGAESIELKVFLDQEKFHKQFGYGRLLNHGGGSTLGTNITWVLHSAA